MKMASNKGDLDRNDPCWKERQIYYKCLNANDFDNEKCELQQMNAKKCKDFWYKVQRERMRKGIKPYVPEGEERVRIKEEFLRKKKEAHASAKN